MSGVLLVRHAPTAWNATRRLQGRADPPLSAAGIARTAAWALPPRFAGTLCHTSPLRRARATAALLGFPAARVESRLVEMDWGAFEGRTLAELRLELGERMAVLEASGLDFQPPGGETPRMVAARLAALLAELPADADAVLVTHKGVQRAAIVLATGWDMLGKAPVRLGEDDALLVELHRGRAAAARAVSLLRG